MRIRYWNLDEFVEEVKGRGITEVYRDFVAESKMVESTLDKASRIPVEMLKIVLTASDGKDILQTEYLIYRSIYVSEKDKKKIRELMEKWDKEVLPKLFPGPIWEIRKGVIQNL